MKSRRVIAIDELSSHRTVNECRFREEAMILCEQAILQAGTKQSLHRLLLIAGRCVGLPFDDCENRTMVRCD